MNRSPLNVSFSTDGDGTWTSFPSQPGPVQQPGRDPYWGSGGNIAVGAPGNVVVVPSSDVHADAGGSTAYYTTNGGVSWNAGTGWAKGCVRGASTTNPGDGDTESDGDGTLQNTGTQAPAIAATGVGLTGILVFSIKRRKIYRLHR